MEAHGWQTKAVLQTLPDLSRSLEAVGPESWQSPRELGCRPRSWPLRLPCGPPCCLHLLQASSLPPPLVTPKAILLTLRDNLCPSASQDDPLAPCCPRGKRPRSPGWPQSPLGAGTGPPAHRTHQGRVRGVATALGPHDLQGLEDGGGRVGGYPHAVLPDLWGEEWGRGESRQGPQDPLGRAPKITWTPGPGDLGGPAWCRSPLQLRPAPLRSPGPRGSGTSRCAQGWWAHTHQQQCVLPWHSFRSRCRISARCGPPACACGPGPACRGRTSVR